MPKEYKLVKIVDVLDIPEDRFDMFLVDLKKWHKAVRLAKQLVETLAKVSGKELPEDYMTMTWLDDDKHEGIIIFKQVTQKSDISGE